MQRKTRRDSRDERGVGRVEATVAVHVAGGEPRGRRRIDPPHGIRDRQQHVEDVHEPVAVYVAEDVARVHGEGRGVGDVHGYALEVRIDEHGVGDREGGLTSCGGARRDGEPHAWFGPAFVWR